MNKEDIVNYVINSPENANPNILRGMLNSLLKENTGDFTTCTVTIVNNSEDEIEFYLPQIIENDVYGDPSIILDAFSGGMQSTDTFTCVLYKGKALGSFIFDSRPSQGNVSTSGSISYDYDANFITITGDGTIAIND